MTSPCAQPLRLPRDPAFSSLVRRLHHAEDDADYRRRQAIDLQIDIAGDDGAPGITRDGDLVVLRASADDGTRNLLIRAEHAARATRYAP